MHAIRHNINLSLRISDKSIKTKFGECIVSVLKEDDTEAFVNVGLLYNPVKSELILSKDAKKEKTHGLLKLKHAKECPAMFLTPEMRHEVSPTSTEKGIRVGVAVLVTSADNHVLLTRRAWHMRTFPGIWVPPGGHVERGETLEEAGLRELKEEAGIDLLEIDKNCEIRPLCLWESFYPPILEFGPPTHQHLVIYLIANSSLKSNFILDSVKLDPNEVDAALTLPANYVRALVSGSRESLEENLPIVTVTTTGEHLKSEISGEVILTKAPKEGASEVAIERLSWGTRYALKECLEQMKIHKSVL
ncbi:nucleoside diphosphate-linked moiety X motif 17-like [Artemia franciscana]|uniref:m7GpppN-mRNA hydrolase NUDT17 n=1 Tax=Artemia franciscana TaxID=6661 RepID=A0AA88LC03_ARTSF|nr:hypothetical protein QYM36_005363 [Artemia franciscana]